MGVRSRLASGLRKLARIAKKRGTKLPDPVKHRDDENDRELPVQEVDISLHANQWRQPDCLAPERSAPEAVDEQSPHESPSHEILSHHEAQSPNQVLCNETEIDGEIQPSLDPAINQKKETVDRFVNAATQAHTPEIAEEQLTNAPLCLVPFHRAIDTGLRTAFMNQNTIHEVIHNLGKLGGGKCADLYAVCGLSAMAFYGFKDRLVNNITITCSIEDAEMIFKLAKAHKGFYTLPGDAKRIGIPTSDGFIRRLVIMPMKRGFEKLHKISVGPNKTSVLSLAGLVDLKAFHYTQYLGRNFSKASAEFFRKDIFWILRKIIEVSPSCPEHQLTPKRATHLIHDNFWLPFFHNHADDHPNLVPGLFYKAGLGIPGQNNGSCEPEHPIPQPPVTQNVKASDGRFISSRWSHSTTSRGSSSGYKASNRSNMSTTPPRELDLQSAICPAL